MNATLKATLILLAAASPAAGQRKPMPGPAEIILIRHGEEPQDPENPHLSPVGVQRAERLVDYVMHSAALTTFGPPVAVFATRMTPHGNGVRTQETVAPLAKALHLQVETPVESTHFREMAREILMNRAYAGKTIVICWNHEEIPQLAAALGVSPEPPRWKGSVYDLVYVISYKGGRARLSSERY